MRVPKTQLYQLSPKGYRVAILYCKLYHRLYAPLLAGLLDPFPDDARSPINDAPNWIVFTAPLTRP